MASLLLTISLEQDVNEGLPGISEDILKIRVTAAQFNSLWEQILKTLSGRLVPFLGGGAVWRATETEMLWMLEGVYCEGS